MCRSLESHCAFVFVIQDSLLADAKTGGGSVNVSLHEGIVQRCNSVLLVFSLVANARHHALKSKKPKDKAEKEAKEQVLKAPLQHVVSILDAALLFHVVAVSRF